MGGGEPVGKAGLGLGPSVSEDGGGTGAESTAYRVQDHGCTVFNAGHTRLP